MPLTNTAISDYDELTDLAHADLGVAVDVSDTTMAASGTTKYFKWSTLWAKLQTWIFAEDAGATDDYAITLSPAPVAYVTGQLYRFKANTANSGVATLNVNALGAKTIKKLQGGITTELDANDIRVGQWVEVVYDGTNMQMMSQLGNTASAPALDVDDINAPVFAEDAGANDTYTATLSPVPSGYVTGNHYRFKANTANTGACTINFNGLGAKTIKKVAGGITTDLDDNDIRAGQWVDLVYDGTNMQMQSTLGNAASGGISGLTTDVIPKAASATTLADSILKQTAVDTITINHATAKLIFGTGGQPPRFEYTTVGGFESIKATDAFNAVHFQARAVRLDAGGSASYYLDADTGLVMGANSIIGFGSNAGVETTWLGVINGNNPGQILVKSTSTGAGGCFAFGNNSPSQITSNQNDYTLTGMSKFIRLSTDASRDITGLRDPNAPLNGRQQDGEEKVIVNVGSNPIVLKHQDANSTDTNRFLFSTGADITLSANQSLAIIYDNTTQRWRNTALSLTAAGIGGSTGATDNRLLRSDGTGGATLQNSSVEVDDAGSLIPTTGSAQDLGSSSMYWRTEYIQTLNVLYLGAINSHGAGASPGNTIDFPNGGSGSFGLGPIRIRENNVTAGSTFCTTPASPSQITSNQNDYAPESSSYFQRWSTDASRNITGWLPHAGIGNQTGQFHIICNVGSFNIVLKHQDTGSAAGNRFLFSTGGDLTLAPNESAQIIYDGTTQRWRDVGKDSKVELIVAASDETTALTTGTAKVTFRMPYAMLVTGIRASLSTAQASGSIFTVDVNDGGTTILSTKITIDNTEKTSTTAATAAVLSDTLLADDAEITIDIDQVGDGTAKGLKVTLIGVRA